MKLSKIILFTVFYLFLPYLVSPISAQVNIIENYSLMQDINQNFGSNAWVVATGDPMDELFRQQIRSYNFRWVIRGHAAWRNNGSLMLTNPEQAAAQWHDFFNNIDGRTIYFEPWNEPERPEECGNLPVNQCADRLFAYMDTLTTNLPGNVILMTPAFDTLNPNHIALIEELTSRGFFSRYNFRAVSYHIYGESNITSYNQQSWTGGLPIVITESGSLENGRVSYSPTSLCRFYQQAVPVWQTDGRVLGWNLLYIDPEGGSGFDLFSPEAQCVVDALQGNFHCQDCMEIETGTTTGSILERTNKCPPAPLRSGYECGGENQSTDCFWAPNLQQACNQIPEDEGSYCAYEVYPDVDVNNDMVNCDENGCDVVAGEEPANMGESGDWNQNGVPTRLANTILAFIGRPELDLPWSQSNINVLDTGYDTKSAPYQVTLAEKDKVMIQAVLSRGGEESNGTDFIIGCAFPSNNTVDAVYMSPTTRGCSEEGRPVYTSELACMNETATYKILTEGLRIENVPFPEEVSQICDDYYGADRFALGAISPTSVYVQEHNVSGQVLGILPHHASNMLWRMLPQNSANSLAFSTEISDQVTVGDAGYLGGFSNIAGYTTDNVSQSDFSSSNMLLSQAQIGDQEERAQQIINACQERTNPYYQSSSTVRIRSILEIIIDLAGEIFHFNSSTNEDGETIYEQQVAVQRPVEVRINYPGWSESNEKIRAVYSNFLPESEIQDLNNMDDPAIMLRNQNTDDERRAQFLPKAQKTTEIADTFYEFSWPQSWQEGQF